MNYHTITIGMHRRQPQDACALVVTERREEELNEAQQQDQAAWEKATGAAPLVAAYTTRLLRKLTPGLSYPALADDLGALLAALAAHEPASVSLLIDATGLGEPIMDCYRERLAEAEGHITACLLTGNDRCEEGEDARGRRQLLVGKRYLLNRLQILLQTGNLKLPKTAEASEVAEDLLKPPPTLNPAADDLPTGGFAVGRQDGLLTALGLSVLKAPGGLRFWSPTMDAPPPDPHGFNALRRPPSWGHGWLGER